MKRKRVFGVILVGLLMVALLLGIWLGWWFPAWDAMQRGGWLDPGPVSAVLAAVLAAVVSGLLFQQRGTVNGPQDQPPLHVAVGPHLQKTVDYYDHWREFARDEQRNMLDFYIEPIGARVPAEQATNGAEAAQPMRELLATSIKRGNPSIVLADFGMGKTWLLDMLNYQLARKALEASDPELARVPIKFSLSTLEPQLEARHSDESVLEQIQREAWGAIVGPTKVAQYKLDLLRAFEENRLVFLLDGLDEMKASSRLGWESFLAPIGDLAKRAHRSAVVITCRRNLFSDDPQERRLADLGFDVFYLWPWSEGKIKEYIATAREQGLLESETEDVLTTVRTTHDLKDITTRAMLTAMLMARWDRLPRHQGTVTIDVPALYEYYIEDRLLDWQARKPRGPTRDNLRTAMEEIAWVMFNLDELTVSPKEVDRYLANKTQGLGVGRFSTIAEAITRDIKTNALLVRRSEHYTFCHASVWEFFVARKLLRAAQERDWATFNVSRRSTRWKSILDNFLLPMLHRPQNRHLVLEGFGIDRSG